jgi:HTH-like domain
VEVARANSTDGTRMVAALASRQLGRPVNRKRVQRVMRALGCCSRPGLGSAAADLDSSASPDLTSCGMPT